MSVYPLRGTFISNLLFPVIVHQPCGHKRTRGHLQLQMFLSNLTRLWSATGSADIGPRTSSPSRGITLYSLLSTLDHRQPHGRFLDRLRQPEQITDFLRRRTVIQRGGAQDRLQGGKIKSRSGCPEMINQRIRREREFRRRHDARMPCALWIARDEQFLTQLIARFQHGDLDRDITGFSVGLAIRLHHIGYQTMRSDHGLRQIEDAHRLARIQHEDPRPWPWHRPR